MAAIGCLGKACVGLAWSSAQVGGTKGGKAQGGHSAQPELAPPAPEVNFGEDNPAPGGSGAGKATEE